MKAKRKVFVLVYDGDAISVHDTAEAAIRCAQAADFDDSFMVQLVTYYEGSLDETVKKTALL